MEDLDQPASVKKQIIQEFNRVLQLYKFNHKVADYFREWYIDGRIFFNVIIDEKNPQRGIIELRPIESTHISKVKGCGGTYLWYPDEIENMKKIGNEKSNKIYLKKFKDSLPTKNTSDYEIKEHIINKYDKKLWC